jgi:Kef-type K+ transport system membrane component KefB
MTCLALGILLATARGFGELAKRFNQPEVFGELLAGVLLGPTVLGALAPGWTGVLFPQQGTSAVTLESVTTLAIVMFLLVAGLEVDLSAIKRHRRAIFAVSVSGMVIPFGLGLGAAWLAPEVFGREPKADPLIFALFFAIALSISALPVIAKTLMDLNLYGTDFSAIVIAASFVDNLAGSIMFALILGMMSTSAQLVPHVGSTIWMTLAFTAATLTVVRALIHRALPWIHTHTTHPGGVLGFALSLALFGAAFTEWIGVHAILGAFLIGVAIGDSSHFREQTRATVKQFVSAFFAPLFFASIGLRTNFATHFDWILILAVLGLASIGKVVGCGLSARVTGWAPREAWAIGFAMNARGAMEIIIGLLAFQYGVISERMFVGLVVVAIMTSMISGPTIQRLLKLEKPRGLIDYLGAKVFLHPLQANRRKGAVKELVQALAAAAHVEAHPVEASLVAGDLMTPSGPASGVAVYSGEVDGLARPLIGVGIPRTAIDFDTSREPAKLIFVVLRPENDGRAYGEILGDLARRFKEAKTREKALQSRDQREVLEILGAPPPNPRELSPAALE